MATRYTAAATAVLVSLIFNSLVVSAQDAGDAFAGSSNNTGSDGADSDAGAAGTSSGAISLSRGGIIAIIIVAVLVGGGGIASAVLYYCAKKRQWEIRKSLRRSARRLTGLGGKAGQRSARRQTGINKLSDSPPSRNDFFKKDLEKGGVQTAVSTKSTTPPPRATSSLPTIATAAKPAAAKAPGFGKKYGR